MSDLTLVIGTRNYSSWSLRPWLLLRHLGLAFQERVLHFDTPEFAAEIPRLSPSGLVPVLLDGRLRVWDSLAICEYASELAGGRGWPAEAGERAQARALAAEMHAGFAVLRSRCPMNARARGRRIVLDAALERDIARVTAIWQDCRDRHARAGPWLFGRYSAVDAMYAPVVLRFMTYGLPATGRAAGYVETALADEPLREWIEAAAIEGVVIPADEAGMTG